VKGREHALAKARYCSEPLRSSMAPILLHVVVVIQSLSPTMNPTAALAGISAGGKDQELLGELVHLQESFDRKFVVGVISFVP
jgi:hypothetical protein